MKFIREMMGRKDRSPEKGALSDEDYFEQELDTEKTSGSAAQANMPSIQARLQTVLEKVEARGTRSERQVNSRQHVEDFRDIVGSRNKPTMRESDYGQVIDDKDQPDEIDLDELSDPKGENFQDETAMAKATDNSPDLEETPPLEGKDLREILASQPESGERPDAVEAYDLPDSLTWPVSPEDADPIDPQEIKTSNPELRRAEPPAETAVNSSDLVKEVGTSERDLTGADRSPNPDGLAKSLTSEVVTMPSVEPQMVEVPAPAEGRSGRRAGRVKTRLLGFEQAHVAGSDPFNPTNDETETPRGKFPVGWLIVLKGPGRGSSFELHNGVSQMGRGEDQTIRLDFGDSSISRSSHAAIAYDNEQRSFFIGHGGKANLVRLNNRPVLSTEEITDGDLIRIGETVLRFVGLCGPDFDWEADENEDVSDAAVA